MKFKYKLMIIFFTLNLFSGMAVFAKEPQNLDITKQHLIKYHDSGEYEKDQTKVINQAMEYLKTRIAQEAKAKHSQPLAIVLDIDETSLSNYPNMLEMSFGGTLQQIDDAENLGKDPVIPATLALYRYAKANHVAIFFITGRKEYARQPTESNLKNAGYENWDGLMFKPDDYNRKTASIYKVQARTAVEKQGYDIVLNIGDQQSDLVGKHADKTFKLPNPYYLIP